MSEMEPAFVSRENGIRTFVLMADWVKTLMQHLVERLDF